MILKREKHVNMGNKMNKIRKENQINTIVLLLVTNNRNTKQKLQEVKDL